MGGDQILHDAARPRYSVSLNWGSSCPYLLSRCAVYPGLAGQTFVSLEEEASRLIDVTIRLSSNYSPCSG